MKKKKKVGVAEQRDSLSSTMLLEINTSSQHALLRDAGRADVMENPLQVRFLQNMSKVVEKIHRTSDRE